MHIEIHFNFDHTRTMEKERQMERVRGGEMSKLALMEMDLFTFTS